MLSFENAADRIGQKRYYFLTKEINEENVVIHGRNFFDQLATKM